MILICGLGNPGAAYANHRHSVGFMAVAFLRQETGATPEVARFSSMLSQADYQTHKILFLRPLTYMNISGPAVQTALRYYHLTPAQLIVIHDELDLPFGKVKIKQGGGHAGHNGLRSVSSSVGNSFVRIRIGIGRPEDKSDISNYVLSDFSAEEKEQLPAIFLKLSRGLPLLVAGKYDNFF